MQTYITNVGEIDTRISGSWVKTWPTKYTGTTVPPNTLGAVNDIYVQYVA